MSIAGDGSGHDAQERAPAGAAALSKSLDTRVILINSGDTGGILQDDWQTVSQDKYNNLKRLWDGSAVDANVCK